MFGSCLCGKVSFEIQGDARDVMACHCSQCRKTSGHYVAATQVNDTDLVIQGAANITWFESSASAKRGFCATCGSSLFWKPNDRPRTSVHAGCLDNPTGLVMTQQICSDDKGDYYDLPLPK
ncbi:GFA family protein [Cognatishimia sp. WU-CL00825]|uniref:GFA family protein n=1 Tax=Cognatishimia sp. WU-CL00825 TaxID=3127658 RepID=UPI00336587AA